MLEIKMILNDLVDYTYGHSDQLSKYKAFYVEFIDARRKGFHGDYHLKTHHIRIFNLYRDDSAIIATTIHELAHHIDQVNRGTSSHGKEFYAEYKKLLYTALDMKLFDKEQYLNATRDASDTNKVKKMIAEYEPNDIGYQKNSKRIIVKNGYEIRDALKDAGFRFNHVNKTWEKVIPDHLLDEMKIYLQMHHAEFDVVDPLAISFGGSYCLYATDGSYDARDRLKEEGFFYDRNHKCWKKKKGARDIEKYKNMFPRVKFTTVL